MSKQDQGERLYQAVERLALLAGEDADKTIDWLCGEHGGMSKLFEKYFSPAAPVQEPLTEREQKIVMFAVHRFMGDAYAQANKAAQDRDNRYFKPGAVDAFHKDAKDAEALIAKLRKKNGGAA